MTQHTDPRRRHILRGLTSRKVRALLCLGIFAAPAAVGTMAYWTDEATITSGGFTAGTLDLTVGATVEDSSNLQGTGGEFAYSTLTIANLVPGESIARPFVVRNFGTAGFSYNASVYTTDNNLVAAGSGLQVAVYSDGTPTNAGTEAAGNRNGACDGGSLLTDQAVSTSTNTVDVIPQDRTLTPGTTQSYCALILLDPSTPNALQGEITQIVIKLDAQQVSVP